VERRRGAKDDHGQWIQKKVEDITEKLKTLFESNGIKISGDILAQIKEKADLSANFYQDLIWLIDVIMQIRNTSVEKVEID
jgi:hypothetical protein